MQVFHGKISIDALIEKLIYGEPTHQICFCTIDSLYALEIIENKEMQTSSAIKTFFSTNLYRQLSNADTLLWQKPWQEIYEMFKEEFSSVGK